MTDLMDKKQLRPRRGDPAVEGVEEPRLDRRAATRKKLTIEVSADLHRRILMICGTRQVPVNQAVREVLERGFPGV